MELLNTGLQPLSFPFKDLITLNGTQGERKKTLPFLF